MALDHLFQSQLSSLGSATPVTPMQDPQLRHVNHGLREQLKLPPALFSEDALSAALFSEQGAFNQSAFAQKYGGHQFGQWNPELGDGRGLLLGNCYDEHQVPVELHLKGAGRTPYSRFGDGRAVLRSTIREYLASEALHGLNIPTSRALCLFSSSESVMRETVETAAMMIRTAPSHIRFGHFEYFYHAKQTKALNALFQYCFEHYFNHHTTAENPHHEMLKQIVTDTATMIALWQAQGFAHGVMNTDNMSIHGITFDFGPYGFMDDYDPNFIPNHSDHSGRYSFVQQPGVGLWNLNALAHAFTPYLSHDEIVSALSLYESILSQHYASLMLDKLGLTSEQVGDDKLLANYLKLLAQDKVDYHLSFKWLSQSIEADERDHFCNHFIHRDKARVWWDDHRKRRLLEGLNTEVIVSNMAQINPSVVLRNHYAQQAIQAAEAGDFTTFEALLKASSHPFESYHTDHPLTQAPPDSGKGLIISCSS